MREKQERRYKSLSRYHDLKLNPHAAKGRKRTHYGLLKQGHKEEYLGTGRNPAVRRIKECQYLEESLSRLDSNIKRLEKCEARLLPVDYDSVNAALPKVYQNAVIHTADGKVDTGSGTIAEKKRRWLKAMKERKDEDIRKHGISHPETLTVVAMDGTKMRSRAETSIANHLYARGISYVYELPHFVENKTIRPDFTILSEIDGETEFIIEHLGFLSDADYLKTLAWKIQKLESIGFVPGTNLFFLGEQSNGAIDTRSIKTVVDGVIDPPRRQS